MKILLALFAEEIVDQDDEQYDIRGARHSVYSETFPFERRVQLIMLFRLEPGDSDRELNLQVRIHGPATRDTVLIDAPFEINAMGERESPLLTALMPTPIIFDAPGTHTFEILLEGRKVWEVPLEVKKI